MIFEFYLFFLLFDFAPRVLINRGFTTARALVLNSGGLPTKGKKAKKVKKKKRVSKVKKTKKMASKKKIKLTHLKNANNTSLRNL